MSPQDRIGYVELAISNLILVPLRDSDALLAVWVRRRPTRRPEATIRMQ